LADVGVAEHLSGPEDLGDIQRGPGGGRGHVWSRRVWGRHRSRRPRI